MLFFGCIRGAPRGSRSDLGTSPPSVPPFGWNRPCPHLPISDRVYIGCTVYVYGKSGFFLNISMRPLDIQNPNLGRGSDLPATGSAVLEEPPVPPPSNSRPWLHRVHRVRIWQIWVLFEHIHETPRTSKIQTWAGGATSPPPVPPFGWNRPCTAGLGCPLALHDIPLSPFGSHKMLEKPH